MKKIMFNDKFGLTKAVLEGRKTMTRRIIPEKYYEYLNAWENPVIVVPLESIPNGMTIEEFAKAWSEHTGQMKIIPVKKEPKVELLDARLDLVKNIASFKVGEVVAVAQAYKDTWGNPDFLFGDRPGWSNKMFVAADLMPHQIRITNVRVERLQDISDEDCLREGISKPNLWRPLNYTAEGLGYFEEAREAFATLIDEVSGKGTFESNPWVFVYEFELVK